jgi:hypothetical protein
MKKIKFTMLALLTCVSMTNAQTTATDFTENDCNGVSHHLFSELDAGKIIVVAFVMPCGTCAPPSLAAYNAVQSYATSNPGRILFYLADDTGATTCSTLSSWGNTNAMPLATVFSTTSFVQSQYGTPGMPKIMVLGGTDHEVLYNANSGVTTSAVQTIIDAEIIENPLPNAPSNLALEPLRALQTIRLTWTDNASDETGFKIERSTDGTNFTEIADLTSANSTTYDDTSLPEATTYHYRVLAYNTNGNSAYSNIAQGMTGTSGLNSLNTFEINVYPNPTSTEINIKIDNESTFDISSLVGKKVNEGFLNIGLNKLDVSNLSNGNYIFKIENKNGVSYKTITVNK